MLPMRCNHCDHDQVTAALVTNGTKVAVSDATVTISDADTTAITAVELSAIGGSTTGTVTVTNAIAISGTTDEVTAALVTAGTLVDVTDATVTISDTPTITELNNIADKTTGVVTATLAAASCRSGCTLLNY